MVRVLALVVALTLLAVPAANAQIFLELVGQTQGPILGNSTFPGEENRISAFSFQQGLAVFAFPGTGQIQRSRSDVTLSKAWDPSSIKLLRAQGEEEAMVTCRFRFYQDPQFTIDPSAGLERRMPMAYLTVELRDARIVSYQTSSAAGQNATESLTFSFTEISYRYEPTGEVFADPVFGPGAGIVPARQAAPSRSPFGEGFEFVLPEDGHVGIEITDAEGRRVTTLYDDDATGSEGLVRWDRTDASGRTVPGGVYTATVRTAGAEITRRMVITD